MNSKTAFYRSLILGALLAFAPHPSSAVTRVLGKGEMLLLSDADYTQFGAIKILDIDRDKRSVVYRWYLPQPGGVDLSHDQVESGTVETQQVRGRSIMAFGPFVFEWHGGSEGKGILSGNGELGVVPLLMASSAIHDATRIRDTRSGYSYEEATQRETDDPLGLIERLSKMPKARLGIGVEETFEDIGMGTQERVVKIARIDPKSNAYAAGLRRGHCILSMEGTEILSTQDFHQFHETMRPNTPISMVVYTGGTVETFTFKTEDRLSAPELRPAPELAEDLTPQQRRRAEAGLKVRELMTHTLEALRATHYD